MTVRRLPLATVGIALAIVATYALELSAGVEPSCLAHGLDPGHPSFAAALVGLFLHADVGHLIGNVLALVIVGAIVEPEIGPARLVALFVSAGLLGAASHALLAPAGAVLVGSSAGILGLLPADMVLRPRVLLGGGATFLALQLCALFVETPFFPPTTSIGAHIGGFVVGAAFVFAREFRASERLSIV